MKNLNKIENELTKMMGEECVICATNGDFVYFLINGLDNGTYFVKLTKTGRIKSGSLGVK